MTDENIDDPSYLRPWDTKPIQQSENESIKGKEQPTQARLQDKLCELGKEQPTQAGQQDKLCEIGELLTVWPKHERLKKEKVHLTPSEKERIIYNSARRLKQIPPRPSFTSDETDRDSGYRICYYCARRLKQIPPRPSFTSDETDRDSGYRICYHCGSNRKLILSSTFPFTSAETEAENAYIDRQLQRVKTPAQAYVSWAIKNFGRKSNIATKLCNAVSKHILGLSEKVKTVTASYPLSQKYDVVFVIHHEDVVDPALHDAVSRYAVYFRKVNCVSNEAEMVLYRKDYEKEKFSTEENVYLNKAIAQHSPSLFREHSNLNVITSSRVKSTGYKGDKINLSEQTCIVLYVNVKGFIPLQEEEFPSKIGDFKTDVMEGYFSVFHKPANEYHEDLKAGCEIHCPASGSTGTIGPFVEVENKKCFLTCCHVICNDEEKGKLISDHGGNSNVNPTCNIPIYQPYYSEDRNEIGKVIQLVFKEGDTTGNPGIDVAVVEITDRHPVAGIFPECSASMCCEIGYSSQSELSYSGEACPGPGDIEQGSSVVMFGSQSGLTRGILRTNVSAVRTTNFVMTGSPYTLFNQLEVLGIQNSAGKPFAKPGDSGALVFLKKGNGPLFTTGLLVGGTPAGQYMVTPIWEVYKEIKCKPVIFTERNIASGNSDTMMRQPSQELENDNFRNEITHKVDRLREDIDSIKQSLQLITTMLQIKAT